jgi:hypothetical protein
MPGVLGRRRPPARVRRLAATACLISIAGLLSVAGPAQAARSLDGVPANLTEQAQSPNFLVHFTSTPGDPNAITPSAAQQLAANGERALGDMKSRLGFPSPMDDGDGRVDLYVFRDSDKSERGLLRLDSRDAQATGWIAVPPDGTGDIVTIAHQIFHLLQAAVYRPAGKVMAEGTATWASLHLYAAELRRLPDDAQFFPDDPLDCSDASRCGRPGYSSWQFFELLAERYGPEVVRRLYDRSRALGAQDGRSHFREALDAVLQSAGTTLPVAFSDFTRTNLVGDYALPGLAKRRYGATEPFGDMATGTRTRRFRPRGVTLDHLAAAFYRLRSGSDPQATGKRCRRARLTLTLTGPPDLGAPLLFAEFRPRRRTPVALVLDSQGRATKSVSWSTCNGRELGLAFYNPSGSVDDRVFSVTTQIKVARAAR